MALEDQQVLDTFFEVYHQEAHLENQEIDDCAQTLERDSPLAFAAWQKAISLLSAANCYAPIEQVEAATRVYISLFEVMKEISPQAQWAAIMGGPPRVGARDARWNGV